jgi:hypothetical protein
MFEDNFEDDQENRKKYTIASIKTTLSRDQIMTFVSGST